MGQSFREQLAQAGALAQRITSKIGGGDGSEGPEEKTELLAVRLSKELQQKDKIIESLRSKLNHHHPHHHRPDTPCSGHALSDPTDQSDRVSYVSDDPGSTTRDPALGSDVDGSNEPGPEETQSPARTDSRHGVFSSRHPSAPPSVTSSHVSCPSMHCCSSPLRPADLQSLTGFPSSRSKPLHGFLLAQQPRADPSSFQSFRPSPFSSYASSLSLDAGVAMRAGAGLLESSALWEMTYGSRAPGAGADLSSGSSGYQSGTGHTGADLMKEHLREIRSLRQRLEDSIQTNERLRQHLEDKMSRPTSETGGPTNIYIQGLD
ncbi:myomegalin, partial [Austrofundulus limnaeus]|uniref:Myomegalin n=1 Tax=Austrofundulus limnaeus TaxID=52670 RepID=A0A2I4ALP0_AUSLI